jgi:hypothetical protein
MIPFQASDLVSSRCVLFITVGIFSIHNVSEVCSAPVFSDWVSLYDPVIQKLELDPAVATNIKRYNLSV